MSQDQATPGPRKKIRIGELLVQNELITADQLATALVEQKKAGRRLGQTLVQLGFVTEDAMLSLLSRQLRIPFVDLRDYQSDPEVVRKLQETHARRFRAIVLEDTGRDFAVGMADPTDLFAQDELARILRRPLRQAIVREADLLHVIDQIYQDKDELNDLAAELGEELAANDADFDVRNLPVGDEAAEAPVAKLLQSLFEDAIRTGASDIHIEPDEAALRVRQRVDGVLREQVVAGPRIAAAVVLRLKLMSGLDISEKRLPQDGRFNIKVSSRTIDVRLSTMPIQHGESVVMRLLDQSEDQLKIEHLGMPKTVRARFRQALARPHGLIIVTGPTGSGKTTTLYAALREVNQASKKIITVEDPVEYQMARINQVQVNSKIELTFASVLRSALRQDPDIVMIGEMRDSETAEIALRAAMTGHLVLSTLHTNDAPSAALRLADMGAEGYLVASSLQCVMAQRLIRRICKSCGTETEPDGNERAWLDTVLGARAKGLQFKKGPGCTQCNGTGYKGRIGTYELLTMNETLADALRQNDPGLYMRTARKDPDFRSMVACAMDYARAGLTSLEEVVRLATEAEPDISGDDE
ncbi:MAG: Flp pilus assembly complex ATPase component [bacterium]|nr:Flp pilus assembly complex ATPase component [bacterium]